jgi:hypothetical protein
MMEDTKIKQENLVLCVKLNGGLYQIVSKEIYITEELRENKLLAIVDLSEEVKLFPEPICYIKE